MDQHGRRHAVALTVLLGALVLSGMLVLVGLDAGHVNADAGEASTVARVDAILARPRGYLFKNVTVRGEVLRIWGGHVVALRSHWVQQGLLIVLDEQSVAQAGLQVGQHVEVTGRVRPMGRAELQVLRRGPAADVRGERLLAMFGGDPYVLATEVTPAQ